MTNSPPRDTSQHHICLMERGSITPLCISCCQSEMDKKFPIGHPLGNTECQMGYDSCVIQAQAMRKHGYGAIVMSGPCPAKYSSTPIVKLYPKPIFQEEDEY